MFRVRIDSYKLAPCEKDYLYIREYRVKILWNYKGRQLFNEKLDEVYRQRERSNMG
ncbi:hypothetical protein IK1_02224 [Bacillus cereus VD146]|uniref:Uncharacterized protein n=1 Tax=Bacillus cereus (strain VD146) TaxID=1053236 RepID=R8MYQ6_BACCX|nr:hypothetical protein IK1_02224 [Bacillus cereus VD146]